MSERYAKLLELPDIPVADWIRIPNDGELFRDGTDVYMGDGTTTANALTPINGGGGGGGAPTNAQYVTLALNGSLSQERVLIVSSELNLSDGGANGNVLLGLANPDTMSTYLDGATNPFVRTSALPASGLTHPQVMARSQHAAAF